MFRFGNTHKMNKILNKLFFAFFASFICLFSMAQGRKQNPVADLPVPPNTVWLKDSLFIDQTEVANIHWMEYLNSLRRDSTKAFYVSQLPDSMQNATETGLLYLHPFWRLRPVIGVSFEQAIHFCKWRSAIATFQYRKDHPDSRLVFVYRLPTVEEWKTAAAGGEDISKFPYGLKQIRKPDTKGPVLMKPEPALINYKDSRYKNFELVDVFAYDNPNAWGIYQMIGNVAEMTSEKYLAKGGSWKHRLEECKIRNSQPYAGPANWLGFRCVCEVKMLPGGE